MGNISICIIHIIKSWGSIGFSIMLQASCALATGQSKPNWTPNIKSQALSTSFTFQVQSIHTSQGAFKSKQERQYSWLLCSASLLLWSPLLTILSGLRLTAVLPGQSLGRRCGRGQLGFTVRDDCCGRLTGRGFTSSQTTLGSTTFTLLMFTDLRHPDHLAAHLGYCPLRIPFASQGHGLCCL